MALTTNETNQVRVDVLGVSVDNSTTWTTTGPQGNRNALDASIAERVVTRLLNLFDQSILGAVGATNLLGDRFGAVIGDETGADQADFDSLGGMNLIQIAAAGGAGGRFEHEQTVADVEWVIPHNLNQQIVSVQVADDAGNTVWGDVDFDTVDRCILHFSNPITGTAVVRR